MELWGAIGVEGWRSKDLVAGKVEGREGWAELFVEVPWKVAVKGQLAYVTKLLVMVLLDRGSSPAVGGKLSNAP